MSTEKATFGAGCFWGVETEFRAVPGVLDVTVGYTGGHTANPTYRDVCSDTTGHVEVVEVVFDPEKVSFAMLVQRFFATHDPTTLNRQGPDVGRQYRSVIFFHSSEQERIAHAAITDANNTKRYARPVVTAVEPASTYYPAEEYHQQYFKKQGIRH